MNVAWQFTARTRLPKAFPSRRVRSDRRSNVFIRDGRHSKPNHAVSTRRAIFVIVPGSKQPGYYQSVPSGLKPSYLG
jgi:hypothetical protein